MAFPAQSPVALRPGARPEPRRSTANCYSCRSRQGLFLLVGAGAGFERLAPWPLTCLSRCLLAAVVSLVAGAACKGGLSNKRCNFCLCCLLPSRAEAAVEGDVERVQGGLPPVGPPLAAPAGRVQAHDRHVEALERGLLGREMPAGVHGPP